MIVNEFIDRRQSSGAYEHGNEQLFLSELCDLLDVPPPDPAEPLDWPSDLKTRAQAVRAVMIHADERSPSIPTAVGQHFHRALSEAKKCIF